MSFIVMTSPSRLHTSLTWVTPALAVMHALDMHDQVDRADDLLADGAHRQLERPHLHHVLDAGQRIARGVGVDRAHRAVMAGVHRLQHVERFRPAHLADDDAIGPHAQRVAPSGRAG